MYHQGRSRNDSAEERWKARFRAARVSLPTWAAEAPHRCVYLSDANGTFEVYTWDRTSGASRQVTDRPSGTSAATIDPTGSWVWWFADTDGDEYGVWMRQPFEGGEDRHATGDLGPAYPAGLALGSSGLALVGRSTERGTVVHLCPPGAEPRILYTHQEDAHLVGLSRDESVVGIDHSEHGDSRHMALRALRPDGTTLADLADGPGKGVEGSRFSPAPGDSRLLAVHERRGKAEPLVWDPVRGEEREIRLDLPGELHADWYADGSALLIRHEHRGRDELLRYDLATGTGGRLGTPDGAISAATARPGGSVEYAWSSAAVPPAIRSTTGDVVLTPPGEPAPPSVPVSDVDVPGPGGTIHALVSTPTEGDPPHPTVVLVHGGPAANDTDSFNPLVAAWVDCGFAVIRANYRGSTGYGSAWRDALEGRVGTTELDDISAVRDWAVSSGIADPSRLVLEGASWGGFLTLLGLGTQPADWSLGIAVVPVADYVTAYHDETESLRAFDRSVFGGSPEEVPERYRASSPVTHIEQVRAPVLVLAGENDPRCPIRQIDNYLARLEELGKDHEVYRFDAGHGSLVTEERIRHAEAELSFARRRLGMGQAADPRVGTGAPR